METVSGQSSDEPSNHKLTPEKLENNGIVFEEDDRKYTQEPADNVASLRAELLDFRNIVTVDDALLVSRYEIPESSLSDTPSEKCRARFQNACSISKEAGSKRKKDEGLWVNFIKDRVFRGWGSSQEPERPVDYFCLTGGVAVNGSAVQWYAAARHRDCPAKDVLSDPKPDVYFSIQIYESLPEPSGFLNQALQNFTFEFLNHDRFHLKLPYSPSKHPVEPTDDPDHHKVCFPFVIVEAKHESVGSSDIERCYCQAANAASCALAMLRTLNWHNQRARYCHAKNHDILPIVTFTFIGYNVKVWLAYISYFACAEDKANKHKYRMDCIWTGDIRNVWDAAQLCSMVDKVAEWFFYIYRPWISACLDQWKAPGADQRLRTAHRSFIISEGLSPVDLGPTATNSSDGAAQTPANSSTLFPLSHKQPAKEAPERGSTLFGRIQPRSRSSEISPDPSISGQGQPESRGQQPRINPGTTSNGQPIDRWSSVSFTFESEKIPSIEGSGLHVPKDKDRASSRPDRETLFGGFGSSASKTKGSTSTLDASRLTASNSDEKPFIGKPSSVSPSGGLFGSGKCTNNQETSASSPLDASPLGSSLDSGTYKSNGNTSAAGLFGAPRSGGLFGSGTSNNNKTASAVGLFDGSHSGGLFGSGTSNNNEKTSAGSLRSASSTEDKLGQGIFSNKTKPSAGNPLGASASGGLSSSGISTSDKSPSARLPSPSASEPTEKQPAVRFCLPPGKGDKGPTRRVIVNRPTIKPTEKPLSSNPASSVSSSTHSEKPSSLSLFDRVECTGTKNPSRSNCFGSASSSPKPKPKSKPSTNERRASSSSKDTKCESPKNVLNSSSSENDERSDYSEESYNERVDHWRPRSEAARAGHENRIPKHSKKGC